MSLDPDAREWLARVLPGARITHVERLSGGFRNENLLLVTATGDRYVLRSAGRTSAVEAALTRRVADTVPVAGVVAEGPVGLLLEFVPGPLASTVLDDDPGGLGRAVGRTLAAIGTVEFDTQGFFDGPDLVPTPVDVTDGLAGFVAERTDWTELRDLAERAERTLAGLPKWRRLVHSDYNPKNLIVGRDGGAWTVRAVLDWEFAFSGPPLADVGNMLRFADDYPPAYVTGFVDGFRDAGGELPEGWRAIAEALDLFALADLLSRGPGSPLFDSVVAVIGKRLS
ncbi:MAG TPA: phosphotransferase [Pseudonocardiaceae bacterium]|nr:phosphotransferase [Pseudonocardiaceae bacterium]